MGGHKRFLFATLGSHGDLYPYVTLARELTRRGHSAAIATAPDYRDIVENAGLRFHALTFDLHDALKHLPERDASYLTLMRCIRRFLCGSSQIYQDLEKACKDVDVLVAMELVLAAPIVAERLQMKYVLAVLSPHSLHSAKDNAEIEPIAGLTRLPYVHELAQRLKFRLQAALTRPVFSEVQALRQNLGLPSSAHPFYYDKFRADLILALFARGLAAHTDWPANTKVTGYVFDKDGSLPEEVDAFLRDGEPPVVFTLSTAVTNPRGFYEEGAAAAKQLGCRAILVRSTAAHRFGDTLRVDPTAGKISDSVAEFPYVPFSELFSRSAAVVHPGGMGTIARALKAGCPMLISPRMPNDQPNNAKRMQRLGVARVIEPADFRANLIAKELNVLLTDKSYRAAAHKYGAQICQEDGIGNACRALEGL